MNAGEQLPGCPACPRRAASRFRRSVRLPTRLDWAFFCALPVLSISAIGAEERETQKTLEIVGQYGVPIRELSGLAIAMPPTPPVPSAPSENGEDKAPASDATDLHLYAVGDITHEVARMRIDPASGMMDVRVSDVAPALGRDAGDHSQWEAVATDGAGTVCMLDETRGEISCLDPGLDRERARFNLRIEDAPDMKGLERAWEQHSNSRGEGMILLRNGHILVLKEKRPAMLIEFGPEGEAPMGYGAESFLREGEVFSFSRPSGRTDEPGASPAAAPARSVATLRALKAWAFSDRLNELAKDASEIALGPDGRVYLLSQESAVIVRLEKDLKPTEKKVTADGDAYWHLPAGMPGRNKAEGLVLDREMHPWIGIDIKQQDRPNLFRMSPLH